MLLECTAWVAMSRSTGQFFLYYEMVSKAINRIFVVVVVVVADVVAAAGGAGGVGVVAGAGCCGFIVNNINTTCTFCYWRLRWCETILKAFRLRGFENAAPKTPIPIFTRSVISLDD